MKKNIYLCGPTVYNTPHIGNMRPILTFDIFIRSLKELNQTVNLIHNITDIDDKIIIKAEEEGVSESEISERYTLEYNELLINYNIETITSMPKVTDNISGIVDFIQKLIDKEVAYVKNGSVYFEVNKDSKYGTLSNRKVDEMENDLSNDDKKNPEDFALWKKTERGITFDSPWSKGRPGWHTECSYFIDKELNGESLDIHSGGIDLLFPHHENEASQFRVINKKEITKEWKHLGHLSIDGEKMSKSLNNTFSAVDFADEVDPDVLRMIFLMTNPTSPTSISEDLIKQVKEMVEKWTKLFIKIKLEEIEEVDDVKDIAKDISEWKFAEAMKKINENIKEFNKEKKSTNFVQIVKMLGFNFSKIEISDSDKKLFNEWNNLRNKNEFEKADAIRDQLIKYGLI